MVHDGETRVNHLGIEKKIVIIAGSEGNRRRAIGKVNHNGWMDGWVVRQTYKQTIVATVTPKGSRWDNMAKTDGSTFMKTGQNLRYDVYSDEGYLSCRLFCSTVMFVVVWSGGCSGWRIFVCGLKERKIWRAAIESSWITITLTFYGTAGYLTDIADILQYFDTLIPD
ncbi:hypothetical protein TWF225_008605 [Orbilia oligospora]|uniref:Uncharacterized protein n=1 Tax=Orbilia oligospora TaxID=2813651 RepID=A0A7C8K7N4_ORBOL|nr:hypothetical protein TWF751_010477 [Orbilia oligospora]KAF3176955.1 hypothetical protein TWF225_008605 [Orbilia oligospora]KAF3239615.1 hypothetical protein TWF128_011722 [Orbilia oligospora]KAF3255424.1 hypothetical protein TWF217_006595 [Orbilia oligospora]KAF3295728.1 hypothetical protein TWF132_001051 [Orbilia oligospora]